MVIQSYIIQLAYNLKKNLIIFLVFSIPAIANCQSNLSYTELTPFIGLLKSHVCCNTCFFSEDSLRKRVLALKWDLNNDETFNALYEQVKDKNLDYRYYLIIAKMSSSYFRNSRSYGKNTYHYIDYYYKSLFLNLAIENANRFNLYKDSLKYQYTQQYILSTLEDSCFPSHDKFKEFADLNMKYCKSLLNNTRLSLSKFEKSELYFIIADAIYRTKYIDEEDSASVSEVFQNLSLAIKEYPQNWRALSERAAIKKNELLEYNAAIKDYQLLLTVFETENKNSIIEHDKWLARQKLNSSNNKSILGIRPTFEEMFEIVDCYQALNDHKNALLWLSKAEISIKMYKQYSSYSEYTSNYEGMIFYFKAIANFKLNKIPEACNNLEKAINYGYDIAECKKLQLEMNCNSSPILNDEIASVPMKKVNGVYEIPITINNVLKLNFIFDAGASEVSISPDVVLTLIKTGTVTDKDFIGYQTYRFADGTTAKSKVFIIKEIKLGNKTISNIKASISNSINAPLLLGQSAFHPRSVSPPTCSKNELSYK